MSSKNSKKQVQEEAVQSKGKVLNAVLWILSVLAILMAAIGNTYFEADFSIAVRVIAVVLLLVLALVLAALTNQGKKASTFLRESRTEVRKVVWPTRPEATQTTLIVFAVTVVTSLLLWGVDSIIITVIGFLTNLRF